MALKSKLVRSNDLDIADAYYRIKYYQSLSKLEKATSGTITHNYTIVSMDVYQNEAIRKKGLQPIENICEKINGWVPTGITANEIRSACYEKFCEKQGKTNIKI